MLMPVLLHKLSINVDCAQGDCWTPSASCRSRCCCHDAQVQCNAYVRPCIHMSHVFLCYHLAISQGKCYANALILLSFWRLLGWNGQLLPAVRLCCYLQTLLLQPCCRVSGQSQIQILWSRKLRQTLFATLHVCCWHLHSTYAPVFQVKQAFASTVSIIFITFRLSCITSAEHHAYT